MSGGSLTVDGAVAGTEVAYGSGHTLEFVATFTADSFQHGGFVSDFAFNVPFAIFSTSGTTDTLFARTYAGSTSDTLVPGNWLGTPHRYRIEWTPAAVTYFIDGIQVASHAIAIGTSMRPLFSDLHTDTRGLSVDWLQMIPYAPSCTFTSRVFDGGTKRTWGAATWTGETPAGTSLAMSVRIGDTLTPDASWSGFKPLANSGVSIGGSSRYLPGPRRARERATRPRTPGTP